MSFSRWFLRFSIATGVIAAIVSCGGGSVEDTQVIHAVEVRRLSFGQAAEIVVAGVGLRSDMVATTGACKDPRFSEGSTPQVALLTCTVTSTGTQSLTITGSRGQLIYQGTLNIPLPQVTFLTSLGNIAVELNPVAAPKTVQNFLDYVSKGYYKDTLFHRVIPGFVTQGGGYTTGMVSKPGKAAPISLESNNGLFNTRGTVAMARTQVPDSATSEFFINLVDNRSLDYASTASPGYAVFGTVVQGMDVADAMAARPTGTVNGFRDVPVTDIKISFALQTR